MIGALVRRIFGGGGSGDGGSDDRSGLYFYVKCRACSEVIRVRINRHNDLSPIEDGDGFHVRKSIVGRNCFRRIEAEMTFDKGYRQVGAELSGATIATREDWDAWEASHPGPAPTSPA
jgi:hypothetical protein